MTVSTTRNAYTRLTPEQFLAVLDTFQQERIAPKNLLGAYEFLVHFKEGQTIKNVANKLNADDKSLRRLVSRIYRQYEILMQQAQEYAEGGTEELLNVTVEIDGELTTRKIPRHLVESHLPEDQIPSRITKGLKKAASVAKQRRFKQK